MKLKLKKGSTVISDSFKSYTNIGKLKGYNFKHLKVNHTKTIR